MALRPSRNDDDDILDFTPDGEEGEARTGQGPLLLSIALGLSMVVAILVTGWYLFADSRGPASAGGVPVVQADPAAIKAKPTDPGGMEVPNQDKLVYERLGHSEDKPQGERLLPPPEKPQSPPKPDPAKLSLATPKPETLTPEPPPPAAEPAKPAEVKPPEPAKPEPPKQEAKPAPKPTEPPAATPAPQQQVAVAPAPETGKLAPPQPLKSETKSAAVTPAPAPETGKLQKPADKPAEKSPPQVAAATPAPAPSIPPTKMAKGDFQIQLAALRDIETAQREWAKIAAANKDVLSGLSPDIVRADLGPKGIFFRLRAGSLDEASARRVCDELGKRKIGCMVVHK